MLAGFILGFAVCWVLAGLITLRFSLECVDASGDPVTWSGGDIVAMGIAVVVWPYLLGRDGDDA